MITANDLGHALFTLGQEPTDGELADMIKEVDLNGERGGAQGQGGSQGLFTLGQEPTDGELANIIKEVDLNGESGLGGVVRMDGSYRLVAARRMHGGNMRQW